MPEKDYILLADTAAAHAELLPLTYTRPAGALRVGIDTIADKWSAAFGMPVRWQHCTPYLSAAFPAGDLAGHLCVAGHVIPDADLRAAIDALKPGDRLVDTDGAFLAANGEAHVDIVYAKPYDAVNHLYDIFLLNGKVLTDDFRRLTDGLTSLPLSPTNTVIGDPAKIFIAEGARVEGAFLNTNAGPIYIGPEAEVMEGSMLRGPIALCRHACLNMGAKVYGATTLGPWCKAGGELNNVVMQAYSNKAHDGFLGNAVIGQWCNIGAGCVASNLKNDYTPIKLWNYPTGRFLRTGLQFCGLIMADHSKAGINTMFNTATVLGVGVNIHGSGFPRNFVPSFSEGSTAGFTNVSMTRFFETARRMMARRGIELTDADMEMFYAIRDAAENYK